MVLAADFDQRVVPADISKSDWCGLVSHILDVNSWRVLITSNPAVKKGEAVV